MVTVRYGALEFRTQPVCYCTGMIYPTADVTAFQGGNDG